MYGLPSQTKVDLLQSLQRTVELGADRAAIFGYAHVPDMIPRQRVIDDNALPDQATRFAMASDAFEYMTTHGYAAIGFDHFALRGFDPLSVTAAKGKLRRNFQGFTDDTAPILIGLGSSAISSFPHLLAQNEKNSGRYRMMISQDQLTVSRGIRRSADDQLRGQIIESLLCQGKANVPPSILAEITASLAPFIERELAEVSNGELEILAEGLPYARTIAALFDPYRRQSQRRFSSAV